MQHKESWRRRKCRCRNCTVKCRYRQNWTSLEVMHWKVWYFLFILHSSHFLKADCFFKVNPSLYSYVSWPYLFQKWSHSSLRNKASLESQGILGKSGLTVSGFTTKDGGERQAGDLHHENSSREAKITCSFCHLQRSHVLSEHTSKGYGLTFKDYMHCLSVQVT